MNLKRAGQSIILEQVTGCNEIMNAISVLVLELSDQSPIPEVYFNLDKHLSISQFSYLVYSVWSSASVAVSVLIFSCVVKNGLVKWRKGGDGSVLWRNYIHVFLFFVYMKQYV